MTLNDMAKNIYEEIGSPKSISIKYLEYWIIENLSNLEKLLNEKIEFNENLSPEIVSIIKKMYLSYYLKDKKEQAKGVVLNKSYFKKIDRSNLSKTYKRLEKQNNDEIRVLTNRYKGNKIFNT